MTHTRPRFKPTEDRITCEKTVLGAREMKLTFTNLATGKQVSVVRDPEQHDYESKARRDIMKDIWR